MSLARRERKIVTVLFCDLVGFTSRAETLDPEDVEAILTPYHGRLRHELERFGGTVEKFIGDAVMALFGAPVAHEDDPERAVRSALAIRDWARQQDGVEVRIAVNTGEALVNLHARPEAGEGMAVGDVVNTTARLEAAAPVNGVLVGEATYRATKHAIDYRSAHDVAAKGKAERIAVWEPLAARRHVRASDDAPPTPLVGRRAELDDLLDALNRARRERSPQLVTLVGVPGIGKSRLVQELMQVATRDGDAAVWRRGLCLPYGDGVTFWALAEIVKEEAGILESDDVDRTAAKLRAAVADVVEDADEAAWVEQQLRRLVGLPSGDDVGDDRSKAFAAWRRFLEALGEASPIVLVFEDLQWADDVLLDFVDYLIDWADDVPLFVLCTARPELLERRPGWGGGKPNAATVSLSPLSEQETERIFATVVGGSPLPSARRDALLARAGGNPLFAEQLARMVAESSGDDVAVPETIQGIIAGRLDTLAPADKSLLQDAAVIGNVFWLGAVSFLQDDADETLEQRLHALVRKEFLQRARRSSVAGDAEYAFRHLLLQDVAYAQIPRSDRAAKHRAAAEWIKALGRTEEHAELLAHHYTRALELTVAAGQDARELAEDARRALRDAGNRAADLNAFIAAARFYEAALELSPRDEPERPLLLLRAGHALRLSGEPRAAELLERAARQLIAVDDLESGAEAELQLADIWRSRGHRENAQHHLRQAQQLLQGRGATTARARVLSEVARFQMLDEENEAAIATGRDALAVAEPLGLAEIVAATLCTIGVSRGNAGDPAGREDVERSVRTALEINSPEAGRAYNNLAAMFFSAGDLRRARAAAEEGIRVAKQFGNAPIVKSLGSWESDWKYADGRWDECLRNASDFIAACEAGSPSYLEGWVRTIRGSVRLARGDEEGALDDARRAVAAARVGNTPQILPDPLGFLLRISAELGRTAEAEEAARELISYFVRGVGGTYLAPLRLAWVVASLGLAAEAREALDALPPTGRWLEAARLVLDGRYGEAADTFVEIGSLPEEAYARLRAAESLSAAGRRDEADHQLEQALTFWRSVGAKRYVQAGEALLAASA